MTDQPDSSAQTAKLFTDEEPCEDCTSHTGRAFLLAFAFAAFAAYVAADFALGGKLTAWTAGLLAGLRRQAPE